MTDAKLCDLCNKPIAFGVDSAEMQFFKLHASCWKTLGEPLTEEKYRKALLSHLAAAQEQQAAQAAELERVKALCRQQSDEIEKLTDMADAVEVLREIGKLIGCGHVDGPDERRQLVNCIDQHIEAAEIALAAERERAERAEGELAKMREQEALVGLKAMSDFGNAIINAINENEQRALREVYHPTPTQAAKE